MKTLATFIQEYQDTYLKTQTKVVETGLRSQIIKVQEVLLDECFLPSLPLKNLFDKLLRRCQYPMEVAITGQFSSGKSTFLNALLSKDVLPTGITPVTSKVNFINYGPEYKLKVTYLNGAQVYHPIENLGDFTDQRRDEVDQIKYLSIYAPMEILKEVCFVDTPGLNSQSIHDTQTTEKILRDVDGIIWLSLIDNAGKQSEAEVLETYMGDFKDKSLCVLNQKDKFTEEEISKSVAHVEQKFSKYFSRVIPISSLQALQSRINQKDVLTMEAKHALASNFKTRLMENDTMTDLDFIQSDFDDFQAQMKRIACTQCENIRQGIEASNINEVLDFIETQIRPRANVSKAHALNKELIGICDILLQEYGSIHGAYVRLEEILGLGIESVQARLDRIDEEAKNELALLYGRIDQTVQDLSYRLFEGISEVVYTRYEEQQGSLFSISKIVGVEYEALDMKYDKLMQALFYDEQEIENQFKKIAKQLKRIELGLSHALVEVYREIETEIHVWQEAYELIKKHRQIGSDLEFAKTRSFAAKVYENVLQSYEEQTQDDVATLKARFGYLEGALILPHKALIGGVILHFEQKFHQQRKAYEKDPLNVSLVKPQQEEIYGRLVENFSMEKIAQLLNSRRTELHKLILNSKEKYDQLNLKKLEGVKKIRQTYEEKMSKIKEVKTSLNS